MEVTPSVGADGQVTFEVGRGANANWQDTQGEQGKDLVSVNAEANDRLLDRAAANLQRRAEEKYLSSRTTDEDIDKGTANPQVAYLEEKLQEVQARLYRSTSPTEQAVLSAEAERLAAEIVTGRREDLPAEEARNTETDADFDLELKEILADSWSQAVETMQAKFSDEEIENFNSDILASEEKEVRKAGAYALKELAQRPDAVTSERVGITDAQRDDLTERYGDDTANAIHVLSHSVAQGLVTPTQAFATAAKNPRVLQALIMESRSGRMQMMM